METFDLLTLLLLNPDEREKFLQFLEKKLQDLEEEKEEEEEEE